MNCPAKNTCNLTATGRAGSRMGKLGQSEFGLGMHSLGSQGMLLTIIRKLFEPILLDYIQSSQRSSRTWMNPAATRTGNTCKFS